MICNLGDPMSLRHPVQGGEDQSDALSCKSFSAKEPRITGLFCAKTFYKDKASYGSESYHAYKWALKYTWCDHIGCSIFISHFLQKCPIIRGSFAETDLQIKASYASSPFCTHRVVKWGVSHKWGMSHECTMSQESGMSHEWGMSHMHESCHAYK